MYVQAPFVHLFPDTAVEAVSASETLPARIRFHPGPHFADPSSLLGDPTIALGQTGDLQGQLSTLRNIQAALNTLESDLLILIDLGERRVADNDGYGHAGDGVSGRTGDPAEEHPTALSVARQAFSNKTSSWSDRQLAAHRLHRETHS